MRVCRAFRGPEHWAFQIFRLGGGDVSHEMDSEKDVGGIPGIVSGDNPFLIEDFGRAEKDMRGERNQRYARISAAPYRKGLITCTPP